jgi:LuxR family maltose regulon positive regulatory protein
MAECEEFAEELGVEPLKGMVKAFQVEYYLRRHDVARALEVSAFADFEPHPPVFFYFIPQLTHIKLLFHTQQQEEGQELLQSLLELGRARHNKNLLVQSLALQAVLYSEFGNTHPALNALQELLTLTRTGGNIRVFLDHGPIMGNLLLEIEKTTANREQITRLLKAFEHERKVVNQGKKDLKVPSHKEAIKLSGRESEILTLVTQGFKNEEIAEKLFISLDTVKKHLYRAYQKLEVSNRVSAIQKVQSLGLITSI